MDSRVTGSRSNTQGPSYSSPDHVRRSLLSVSNTLQSIKNRFKKKTSMNRSLDVLPLNVKHSTGPSNCHETHPRKRAVLCGVTYQNNKYRLKGTINDVKKMRDLLIDHFGYSKECIRVLTEEEDPAFIPTKKNIQDSLKWLVEGSEPGDRLVFYFSGHGLRQPDFNNDERDGFDETICPVDFMQEGMILDNDINSTIVRPLKKNVTLHAIVDACHSGTILDLECIYNARTKNWEDNSPPSKAKKCTDGGIAIGLSACGDDQMAADTSAFTGDEMAGAMTYALIQTVQRNSKLTYGSLLEIIHETLEQVNNGKCFGSRFLHKVFHRSIIQDPLLSSSEEFEVYQKEFVL
ncbi:metacaspase-1-like isoform X2 [Alnus glutinosa]|uniref:metacaspase-1-like isoform X2 n=1 Tax=Alnus glutinosa TaxID=3517 RepID=UPI002D799C03|nr:metacaspase-1-like isoform X2 [Alnus glutinosa]